MPMSALAAAGIPLAIDAVIRLAQAMAGTDFAAEARSLDRMGLAGTNAAQIRRTVQDGFS